MNVATAILPDLTSQDANLASMKKAATDLVPVLRERMAATAKLGRLPDETIADLNAHGFFDITTPKRYGGPALPLRGFLEIVSELGRGDGSVAWVAAITNVTTWAAAAFLSEEAAQEVFCSDEPGRVVGVLSPRMAKVKKVEGGYLIEEGLWGFNSGVYHANWDLLGIPLVDDDGVIVDQGTALIPVSDLTIHHDWNVIAIQGSGSSTVSAKNVFVPEHRVSAIMPSMLGLKFAEHLADEPLYRTAVSPILSLVLVYPMLGLGQAALDVFKSQLPKRGIQYTGYAKQSEAPVTHLQLGEASAKIEGARMIIEHHTDYLDREAVTGRYPDAAMRAKIRRDVGLAEKMVWEGIDMLASASGGSLAGAHNPMNKIWQDARVASLHGFLVPNTNFEAYGRLECGLDAGTPFI